MGILLMLVPILNAYIPDDDFFRTLKLPAKLLLLPGDVLIRPLEGAPDLPLLIFANWLFFTAILWPMIAIFRRDS